MQWIILLGHEVCAIGFEKITCMSSFCHVVTLLDHHTRFYSGQAQDFLVGAEGLGWVLPKV